jgi:mannose-1-phosphate guanylyltransferase
MKAFLLAGGVGSRLRPLTDSTPKCLLPVQGTPMLRIWFTLCREHGIDEVLINLHAHADVVRGFIERHSDGLKVTLFEETSLLGSAGTIRANRDWIKRENAFWIFYADVLTSTNLDQMLAFHNRKDQLATLGVYEVADPTRCGIVQVDECDIVRDFVEKPKAPVSRLAFSGLMLAKPAIVDLIPDLSPVDLGFHVLPKLVGRMAAYKVHEFLIDMGTLETYQKAQEAWPGPSEVSVLRPMQDKSRPPKV